jgi:S-layer protein (TIGR01567 family)
MQLSNKTKSMLMFLVLSILAVSATMCLGNAQNASTSVSINITSGSEKITVYIPVLLDETGKALEMYQKPVITGNATTAVVDTDHGKVLKISVTGTIEVNMNQTDGILATYPEANEKFVNGFTLSTSNATHYGDIHDPVDAWIYSEDDTGEKLEIRSTETYFNLSKQKGILVEGRANYSVISLGGETYAAVGGKSNKIARILIDYGEADTKEIVSDDFSRATWDMGEGYTLTAQSVYSFSPYPDREIWTRDKNGTLIGQARLILKKDGMILKNKTIPEREAFIYSANISNETNVPVFVTYLDQVWEGAAMDHGFLRYTWLMSQDVKEIKRGDRFGGFKVASATAEKIILKNNSDTVISFSINRDNGWGRDMRIFTEQPVELTEGWQAVKLSAASIMYD